MLLLEGKKKLGSMMGLDSGSCPVIVVVIEVSKQYMGSRSIRNGSRNKGYHLVGVK